MTREPKFPSTGKTPFRVDSDEGCAVVVGVIPALLENEDPFEFSLVAELPAFRLRLTNEEAADLLYLLDGEVGAWARERAAALRAFRAGEGSLSVVARAEFGLEVDPDEGLDEFDPSRSDYGERLAELGDARRKQMRESR